MKKTPPKFYLFFLQISMVFGLNAQNLVPNYSFENYSQCPTTVSQVTLLDDWYVPVPSIGTSDYFNTCAPPPPSTFSVHIPNNWIGDQETLTGEGYAGFATYLPNSPYREYLQAVLDEPMIAGECYEVEMFTSLADNSNYAMNSVGIHLSATPPPVAGNGYIYATPQVYYTEVISDTENWVPLTASYVAVGGEQYITLGIFLQVGEFAVETLSPPGGIEVSYYYVEDVRVELAQGSGEQDIEVGICEGECYEFEGEEYCDEGTYEIPVQGCFSQVNLTIIFEEATIATIEEPDSLDCNTSSIFLDASGSSSGPEFSYQWTGPNNFNSTILNPEVFDPGIYTLIVDGVGFCPAEATIEVIEEINLPDISSEVSGLIDCNNLVVTLTGTSETPNVTYHWTGPGLDSNGPVAITSQSGTYTLVVSSSAGCTSSEEVIVEEDLAIPDIFAEVDGIIDCNNLVVTLIGSSETPNVTFHWFGPGVDENTASAITVESGTFILTVTAPNGCTNSEVVTVFESLEPPDIFAEVIGVLDCDNSTVTLSGSSITPNVTFLWFGPGVNSNQPIVETDLPGNYTFEVLAPNGCISTLNVEVIEENTQLDISATVDGILTCENETVTLTGSTETQNVTYQWTGPGLLDTIPVIEVEQAGEYTFSISNGSGCMADTTILVVENIETPEIIINLPDTLNCNILSVDLDASGSSGMGNLIFEWQNENGDSLGNDSVLNVDTSGNYTLILMDEENGCTEQSNIEVFEDTEEPVSTISSTGELDCQTSSVTLDGNSSSGNPLNFQWLDENDEIISNDTSIDVTAAGIYTLLVSNTTNACTNVSTIEIEINAELPTAIIEPADSLNCNNTEATLDGTGSSEGVNIIYEWQNPLGDSIANVLQTSIDAPGVYTLIVFNTENGCSASASLEVFQDIETPIAVAGEDELITCDESTVTLDGSASSIGLGSLSFQWTNSNNQIISDLETVEVNAADIYTLTVIAENGCSASDEIEVTLDTNVPVADPGAGGTLNCEIEIITLGGNETSSGINIEYQWLDESSNEIATTSTTDISTPGTYTLIVTDISNSCSISASIVIPQDIETPIAEAGNNETLNCLVLETQLDGSQSSAGPEFEYEWLNSNSIVISNEVTFLTSLPDTYILIVTNTENSCTAESTVEIDQNIETPIADAGNNSTLTCDINEIALDGSSSTGNNLSFEWFNSSQVLVGNQVIIQVSEAGIYDLIVTNDVSGCTAQSSVEVIPDDNLPTAIATADAILTCENIEVIIDGSSSTSISGNIGFEWLDDSGMVISTLENATSNSPGIYTLIVTDTDNACSISTTVEIQQDIEAPIAIAGEDETLICGQTDLMLDAGASTGQNLSFEWQDNDGNIIANSAQTSVSTGGIYIVIVTNTENGCMDTDEVEITPDTNLPTADAGNSETLTCDLTQITLDGSASSEGQNIEYQWQNAGGDIIATTQTTVVNLPGTYILFVLDTDNNCQSQDQVIINENIDSPTALIDFVANQEIDCNNSTIVLDGSGSMPFGTLNFEWTTNDGIILSGESTPNPEMGQAGTYILTIINTENGCTDSETIELVENLETPTALINQPEMLTCVVEEIHIDATGSSSSGNFIYIWTSNPAGGIIADETTLQPTANQPGNYTLTVLNNDNGCQSSAQISVLEDITSPTAIANSDEEFDCITESITLDGEGSSIGNPFIYQWSGAGLIENENTLNPTIFQSGNYTLQVTNTENGCTQTAAILVEEDDNIPTAAEIAINDPLCFGQSGSISIIAVTGGHEPYLYSIDGGQNFSPSSTFSTLAPGDYTILIQDAIGCEYEESVFIETPIPVDVTLAPEVVLELGQDYQLTANSTIPLSQIDTIIWSPFDNLSCTNCLDPRIESVLNEIEYSVTIIDENGCKASDRIMLRVEKTREVFIPNAFSPNDDGTNDKFRIFANNEKVKQINTFQVFDRWGEIVYQAYNFQLNDVDKGWNGILNEEKMNPAVFVYFAEIEFIDGVTILYKGDVTLTK